MAVVVVAALFPLVDTNRYHLFVGTTLGVYLLVVTGLNLLLGFGGQVSLGHGALVAVGAYTTAITMVDYGFSFWAAAGLAMVLTAVAGAVMALPAFRLSAWYFALITLVFAQVVEGLLVELRGLTNGFAGITRIPLPALGARVYTERDLFWLVLVVNVVACVLVRNLVQSRFGRGLVAVREGDEAARASGASVVRLKVFAFVFSAALAGLAGSLFAVQKAVITPDDFRSDFSVFFLVVVVLGGAGRLWGPVIGTLVFFAVPELLESLASWRLLVYGVALLALMVFAPHGLTGLAAGWLRNLAPTPALPRTRRGEERELVAEAAATQGLGLSLQGVTKTFGGVRAVDDVSLTVAPGSIHAIVGPNGSGKTTMLNLVSGFYATDSGSIRLGETEISGRSSVSIARAGVGRTFQTPKLLPDLTVVDNVLLGAYARERATGPEVALRLPRAGRERRRMLRTAAAHLEFVGLADRADALAGDVPHGQQRLVEIARALVGEPRLLLLDEPAAGLSLSELDRLGDLINAIRGRGLTVVIVEHHVELIEDICDAVSVLDQGRVLATGTPAEVFRNAEVVSAYMGASR